MPEAVDLTDSQDGGVLKEIVHAGIGDDTPLTGDTVTVHYVGTLTDGTKFDSSRDRGEHFEFEIGKGAVIRAWEIGVASMKKKELARLTCKPEYAYGQQGSGKIPPNATLIFEVELIDWKGEDISPKKNEGSIIRQNIDKGQGYLTPNDGATVKVHLTGEYEGQTFDDRDVTFLVGEGADYEVIEGVDIAIKKFKKGEKSRLSIQAKYAFGQKGSEQFGIPADAPAVHYTVTLQDFEKAKESWQMDIVEKIDQSEMAKTKGTTYFKNGRYKHAVKQYKQVNVYLESLDSDVTDAQRDHVTQLQLAAHLNLAMCYLKIEDHFNAEHHCDRALEKDGKSEKGLYRRGQARIGQQNYEGAREDFEAVIRIDTNNKAAKKQLMIANQKGKAFDNKEKKTYYGMFDRIAKDDDKLSADKDHDKPAEAIGTWDNKMADGMLPIEKEAEAFSDVDVLNGGQLNEAGRRL